MLSADPARKVQATFNASAVFPFLISGCLTLLKSTHVYRASIKRFNFFYIIARVYLPVNHF